MSRDLTAAAIAESIKTSGAKPVYLCKMEFDSGTTFVWSGRGDLTFDGDTYLGLGDLGRVGPVEESTETRDFQLAFELSGVDPSFISLALSEPVQGRRVTLWLGFLDSDYQLVEDPGIVFKGRMDTMDIELGTMAKIVVTATSRLVDWDRPRLRRCTSASHKQRFPGDKFFDLTPISTERELVWGRAR